MFNQHNLALQALKEIKHMTQAITDLTTAVNASIAEMATLTKALNDAVTNSDDAQVEILAKQLNDSVAATQAAMTPVTAAVAKP